MRTWLYFLLITITIACSDSDDDFNGTVTLNPWLSTLELPLAVSHASAEVLANEVIILGGFTHPDSGVVSGSILSFDPSSSTFSELGKMITPRAALSTVQVQGKIWTLGGIVRDSSGLRLTTTVEVYDPDNDAWENKGVMKRARADAAVCECMGKVYVFGSSAFGNADADFTMEIYDPAIDEWQEGKTIELGASFFGGDCITQENTMFFFVTTEVGIQVFEFDPGQNIIQQLPSDDASKISSSSKPKVQSINDLVYVLEDQFVAVFSTEAKEWVQVTTSRSKTPLLTAFTSVAVNDEIFAFGGTEPAAYFGLGDGRPSTNVDVAAVSELDD